jgi:hypothetical protein
MVAGGGGELWAGRRTLPVVDRGGRIFGRRRGGEGTASSRRLTELG